MLDFWGEDCEVWRKPDKDYMGDAEFVLHHTIEATLWDLNVTSDEETAWRDTATMRGRVYIDDITEDVLAHDRLKRVKTGQFFDVYGYPHQWTASDDSPVEGLVVWFKGVGT